MKRYNLLIVLLLLAFNVATAQKSSPAADFSAIGEAKTKIENTVPLVLEHLKTIADKEGDNSIYSNGKTALGKEYAILQSEFWLYNGNMSNCIMNNSSKKAKKCMQYHTQYLRNTLINYNNYISYITKKNGYIGVDSDIKKDFTPSEITKKLGDSYYFASEASQRMKGTQKKEFLEQPKSDDYKLKPYSEVAP